MHIVIFITAKDVGEAETIAEKLVQDRLIACANIVSGIKSIFRWEGKVDKADEVLMILKTKKDLFPKIEEAVRSIHSYDVPEIIALPISDGHQKYLDWINESV